MKDLIFLKKYCATPPKIIILRDIRQFSYYSRFLIAYLFPQKMPFSQIKWRVLSPQIERVIQQLRLLAYVRFSSHQLQRAPLRSVVYFVTWF
jgi:hypothetical protein